MSINENNQFALKDATNNPQQISSENSDVSLTLEKREDGQLWVMVGGREKAVRINCCFPWSNPLEYISLLDKDDKEVALINQLTELDDDSRDAVMWALSESRLRVSLI